jgi:predicted ATP-dependent endonuclease of OLD family
LIALLDDEYVSPERESMRIEFVEIANFRKLRSAHVSFSKESTVFVGANNSGKTSAMVALRYFLVPREQSSFTLNDFTLSGWPTIDAAGLAWEQAKEANAPLPEPKLDDVLPFLDVWLHVDDTEVHYVRKILPTLEWTGGRLGVRLRLEPDDSSKFQAEYLAARADAKAIQQAGAQRDDAAAAGPYEPAALWPENLTRFMERRLATYFRVKSYVLDPTKCVAPEHGAAKPQVLPNDSEPLDSDPFKGLIRIDEISAQRGFGQHGAVDVLDENSPAAAAASGTRRLSEQLRSYYNRHLDPSQTPDAQDLAALKAIEDAQKAFDSRLKDGFAAALKEMEKLGYPGVTDPKLHISTRLRPVDGLNHEAAVQYVIQVATGGATIDLRLPEHSNGLGYQNLISMVFRLMSFRDAWMRVGKAQSKAALSDSVIPPLHLVLIEEPEAHLHTQVQQVFIRQAYKILRSHKELQNSAALVTQLVVSTHSSHIAHECEFASLRYFRRLPATAGDIPVSCVVNLTNVFGDDTDTKRFVTRYLKVTHCDLLFADAAVFIEGPAERILVPHFVRSHPEFADLLECYITWLEIAGSHAHRLRELVESLGLTTLIITDLDAMDAAGKSCVPLKGAGQRSRNATLTGWCPAAQDLDELLSKAAADKIMNYEKQRFSIRVAYQHPTTVVYNGEEAEALANTLEDSLVFENLQLFAALDGKGLVAKFKEAVTNNNTVADLSVAINASLKEGNKAELALDLLEIKDRSALKPPTYIRDGLLWLAGQLRQNQIELGLPVIIEDEAA